MALPTRNRFPNEKGKMKHFLNWINAEGREAEVGGTDADRDKLILDYRVAQSIPLDWVENAPLIGR